MRLLKFNKFKDRKYLFSLTQSIYLLQFNEVVVIISLSIDFTC